jgi:hypothetical protein
MARIIFPTPVLPGKQASSVSRIFEGRMAEYEESRRQKGITVERVYEMETPMGTLVTAYIESDRGFEDVMGALATSDLLIDRDFRAALTEIHGMDMSKPPEGATPEIIGDWRDPEITERRRGTAFTVPVMPGRSDAARAFAREAFGSRVGEHAASRRALGINQETVALSATPMGDMISVYLEGTDPDDGNRRFSASQSAYDLWFKEQLSGIFPPQVDFSQPMPPSRAVFEWNRAPVTA